MPAARSALSSSGWAAATSSAEMIVVSGLRSSCDASPTNRCCAAWPASIRASISFMVTASAAISSRLSGTGTRPVRSDALMSATRERISSTDLIERRTRTYVAAADTAMTNGAANASATTTVRTVAAIVALPSPTRIV